MQLQTADRVAARQNMLRLQGREVLGVQRAQSLPPDQLLPAAAAKMKLVRQGLPASGLMMATSRMPT